MKARLKMREADYKQKNRHKFEICDGFCFDTPPGAAKINA
jgi:hypothetical protein